MMEAVTEGVRQAFVDLIDIPNERLYDAIRNGVADAIWRVATNGTATPSGDFYYFIKEGVREGMSRFRDDGT